MGNFDGLEGLYDKPDKQDSSSSSSRLPSFSVKCQGLVSFVSSQHMFEEPEGERVQRGALHLAFLVEHSLQTWGAECGTSCDVLATAYHGRRDNQIGRNLSLVCLSLPGVEGESARFVHWQIAGTRGRPVELDSSNRVKALVCVGVLREPLDMSNAYIIQPDTGVPMQRARGVRFCERPVMTSQMVRLQSMCNQALHLQSGEAQVLAEAFDGDGSCLLCSGRFAHEPFPPALGIGHCNQCPLCLQCLSLILIVWQPLCHCKYIFTYNAFF